MFILSWSLNSDFHSIVTIIQNNDVIHDLFIRKNLWDTRNAAKRIDENKEKLNKEIEKLKKRYLW